MNWAKTEPVRLYVWGVVGPLLALLALKGVIAHDEVGYYVSLAAALLGVAGGTEFARSKVDSPATVEKKTAGGSIDIKPDSVKHKQHPEEV